MLTVKFALLRLLVVISIFVGGDLLSSSNGGTLTKKGLVFGEVNLSSFNEVNGINPKKIDRFWEDWHLVTVRYRKDNGEQRFV
jgi:hypothetical protein